MQNITSEASFFFFFRSKLSLVELSLLHCHNPYNKVNSFVLGSSPDAIYCNSRSNWLASYHELRSHWSQHKTNGWGDGTGMIQLLQNYIITPWQMVLNLMIINFSGRTTWLDTEFFSWFKHLIDLRGKSTPNQNWAYLMCYLKILSSFFGKLIQY